MEKYILNNETRKLNPYFFINKKLGGIIVLESMKNEKGSPKVICKCLSCNKSFEVELYKVSNCAYKSCGCRKRGKGSYNPRWKGIGDMGKSVLTCLKLGAKKRNLEFNITMEQIWDLFIKQNRKCALSGLELNFQSSSHKSDGTASLDRIDSSKGYNINNIQWVHKDINFAKQSMNNEEFLQMIKTIYEYKIKQ